MDPTDIARWQFAITTVYHFLFVPITIGLSAIIASYETAWLRTGNEQWLRLTKFFGKLFLINFAIGVVTGIVQEFQFGMNWSDYSRFVGDVFGAPLAIEGLLAFFLESTFLGLWIFGWERLVRQGARRLHLAGAHRHPVLRLLHPRGQLLDAAPRRLRVQPRHRSRRDERLRGGALQQGAARHLPPRRPVGVHDRCRLRRRHRVLAHDSPAPPRRPTCLSTGGRFGRGRPCCSPPAWASRSRAMRRARS